jgi:chemotaxis protein MotA
MNKNLLFGFVGLNIYDTHAALLVIGGTFTITIFCFSFKDLRTIIVDVRDALLDKHKDNRTLVIEDLVNLAKAKRRSEKEFMSAGQGVREPFLKDAARLLFWAESETSAEDFRKLLQIKADSYVEDQNRAPTVLKSISKFPPAFGLMGTVLGIVSMMSKLSNPNAKSQIGPSMAIALMATLYGIGFNNLIVIPMSEALGQATKVRAKTYDLIIEGVMMIHEKKPINYIKEKLTAFLGMNQKANEP